MKISRRAIITSLAALLLSGIGAAQSLAAYPEKPIRLIVAFAAGGGTDILARRIAEPLSKELGVPIVIENIGGAAGAIGAAEAARAPADGYTLIFHSPGSLVGAPLLAAKPTYDPLNDFTNLALVATIPEFIAINPKIPANSLTEFAAYCNSKQGGCSYGTSGPGTLQHIVSELFRLRAGNPAMVHVPYKGGAPAIQDLISGVIDMFPDTPTTLLQLAKDGKIKLIAVLSDKRIAAAPDIPTSDEAGIPNFKLEAFQIFSGPAGLPADVAAKLSAAVRKTMQDPALRADLEKLQIQPVVADEAKTADYVKKQVVTFSEVINAAGMKTQ